LDILNENGVIVGDSRQLFISNRLNVNKYAIAYLKMCLPDFGHNFILEPQRPTDKTNVPQIISSRLKEALRHHYPNYDWLAVRESVNQTLREKRPKRGSV